MAEWWSTYYGFVLAFAGALSLSLEIGSKKIKPFSWLLGLILGYVGKLCNKDISTQMQTMQNDMVEFKAEVRDFRKEYDIGKCLQLRKDISQFVTSLQRDEIHTQKDFERVLQVINDYHELIDKHQIINGNIEIETEYINKVYAQCLIERKFFEG